MLNVVLAWPKLEIGLTYWISLAIKLRPSETGILLGVMDTKSRINKLKALYTHRNDKEAVTLLKTISKEHETHSEVRNIIAHAQLLGASKAVRTDAYFLTSRAIPDRHGFMVIERVNCDEMNAAARFATNRAKDIRALLKARGLRYE